MDKPLLICYKNGNAEVKIYEDGTRIIEHPEDVLLLDFPLNIDIKLTSKCSLGYNPKTKKSFCSFCHESARTDGKTGDMNKLKKVLEDLPPGIELAIGANSIEDSFINFFQWCKTKGFIVNLTINQMHIKRDSSVLEDLINEDLIKGLGLSLRNIKSYSSLPVFVKNYPNTVVHVIAGLDRFEDIYKSDIKKILILGYKVFGEGKAYYDSNKESIEKNLYEWKTRFILLSKTDKLVSFDNLSLKQLDVRKWFNKDTWNTFYQGENSFYIDSVREVFSPSSRSEHRVPWGDMSLRDYYKYSKTLKKD